MLDLFCGTKGASEAFRRNGWSVVTVDNDPAHEPTIETDLTRWRWGPAVDFIWASPPCTEFSRESMPWCKTGAVPSLALVDAAKRIIAECAPRFWIMENVRGAVPYLGQPRQICGPFYLWGDFPPIACGNIEKGKERMSSAQKVERAAIPLALSEAVYQAITAGMVMLPSLSAGESERK